MPCPNFHVALSASHTGGNRLSRTARQLVRSLVWIRESAGRISDIEGIAATGDGKLAGKRSEFQIRVRSLGGSFFHLSLRFPNVLH